MTKNLYVRFPLVVGSFLSWFLGAELVTCSCVGLFVASWIGE